MIYCDYNNLKDEEPQTVSDGKSMHLFVFQQNDNNGGKACFVCMNLERAGNFWSV